MSTNTPNQLIFPIRGNPPPEQPGYTRDPGNPWIFNKTFRPITEIEKIFRLEEIKKICKDCSSFTGFKDQSVGCASCNTCGTNTVSMIYANCPLGKFKTWRDKDANP